MLKRTVLGILFAIGVFSSTFSFADSFLESALKDGIGVRPFGMGGAFVAVSDDGDSIYYNPAYLPDAKNQFIRSYMDMNTDIYSKRDFYSVTFSQGGFGNYNVQDKSGNKTDITMFSFGARGQNGIAWGLTYKNISWDINSSSGRGYSMDCGLKASFTNEINAGVLIQDVFKNSLPVSSSLRIGVSYKPVVVPNTIFAIDGEFRNLKSQDGADVFMHYGAETKITDNLFVRGGWQKGRFSGGITAETPYFVFDYAVVVNSDRENTQMFGFRLTESN